jgi:hypothetical protein
MGSVSRPVGALPRIRLPNKDNAPSKHAAHHGGRSLHPIEDAQTLQPCHFRHRASPTVLDGALALTDPERTVSYEGRRFKLVMTAGTPTASSATVEFHQKGEVVTGWYSGDGIEHGALVAVVRAMGCLEGRFHHVTGGTQLEMGRCWATPQPTPRGRMRLYVEWQMGGREGVSVLEET